MENNETNTQLTTGEQTQTPSPVDTKRLDKIEIKAEGWKRYLAYSYIIICLTDFALMPLIFEVNRPDFTEVAKVIGSLAPEAQLMALNKTSWQPITLAYSGLFHLVMGAILTGVAVFNNKFSNGNPLQQR